MKKIFSKKANLITIAAIAAAVVIGVGIFTQAGSLGGDSNGFGSQSFFSGMFHSSGSGYAGGYWGSSGNSGPQSTEAIEPVVGPGTQNGALGGS